MEKLPTLHYLPLNDEQKKFVFSLINNYGTGQHPICDEKTIDGFMICYLKEIINGKKFKKIKHNLSEYGIKMLAEIEKLLMTADNLINDSNEKTFSNDSKSVIDNNKCDVLWCDRKATTVLDNSKLCQFHYDKKTNKLVDKCNNEISVYFDDIMYLPIQYHKNIAKQPFYEGRGNHSVKELEEICEQYKEYTHQQQVIKSHLMNIVVGLKFPELNIITNKP